MTIDWNEVVRWLPLTASVLTVLSFVKGVRQTFAWLPWTLAVITAGATAANTIVQRDRQQQTAMELLRLRSTASEAAANASHAASNAAKAETVAAEARTMAAKQQERAAEQEERAAHAEASLLELQEARRPRRIDSMALYSHLRREPLAVGIGKIAYFDDGTNEPAGLAKEIAEILRISGTQFGYFGMGAPSRWTPPLPYGGPDLTYTPNGVAIVVGNTQRRVDTGEPLQRALAAAGVAARVSSPPLNDTNYGSPEGFQPRFPADAVMIVVGRKE